MRPDILEELYQKHYSQAYAYTLALCKNREDAEDIVADAFVKAFYSFERDSGDFQYWLLVVCRNLWIDRLRRSSRLQALRERITQAAGPEWSPEERSLQKERASVLLQGILSLPPQYREVLSLHYYAGLPTAKIARMTQRSNANVKTILCRGREKLKKELEENGYALEKKQKPGATGEARETVE